jgi:hypothetical protein
MLALAFLIVAAILFALAAAAPVGLQPHQGRLVPLGLFFGVLSLLVPLLG